MKTVKIKVKGRVQAVFYRDGVKKIANQNNLSGKVENKKDGTVEILASGDDESVKNLIDWCYTGSLFSRVEALSFEYLKSENNHTEDSTNSISEDNFGKRDFLIKKNNKNYFVDKLLALLNFISRYTLRFKNINKKYFKNKSSYANNYEAEILENVPKHLVIIPDGNRRWATENSMLVWRGHRSGADNLKDLIEFAFKQKVKYITAWGFSTENWQRDEKEVSMLMNLFLEFIKDNKEFFLKNKISFHHFGRRDRLSVDLLKELDELKEKTKSFTDYNFAIALDYGGRDEIKRAMSESKNNGDEKNFEKYMDTMKFPEVDLIIRTGGEKRSSGIMPWQSVYAEYYFSNLYFPDFKREDLYDALLDYSSRKRRFGK